MQEFLDLIKTRRSIRSFKDVPIEKEKIDAILTAALMAPSSRGRRPWEFIAVTDRELLALLSACREGSSAFVAGAALAIIIVGDPEICDVWVEDCSIASILMQLTAHSLGLGSCWIQVRERSRKEMEPAEDFIKQALEIPEHMHVECMIALGVPDEQRSPYEEGSLPYDKLHRETFDCSYFPQ